MTTTTNVKQLKLNIMTQAQYDTITPNPSELYMVTDAEVIPIDDTISSISENPVQNKVISTALDEKVNTSDIWYDSTSKTLYIGVAQS